MIWLKVPNWAGLLLRRERSGKGYGTARQRLKVVQLGPNLLGAHSTGVREEREMG
jgi:hypothetical protein